MFKTPGSNNPGNNSNASNNEQLQHTSQPQSISASSEPVVAPRLSTPETSNLRNDYPNIEHLEAGNVSSWLMERADQLTQRANEERDTTDTVKLFSGAVTAISLGMFNASPLIPIGCTIAGIGYLLAVLQDMKQTHKFAPIPFVRDSLVEFITRNGSADARNNHEQNDYLNLLQYLSPFERSEVDMINCNLPQLSEYLSQAVESGKRFYAYRWLLRMYDLSQGNLPDKNQVLEHMKHVKADSRVNYGVVEIIQNQTPNENSLKRFNGQTSDNALTSGNSHYLPSASLKEDWFNSQEQQPNSIDVSVEHVNTGETENNSASSAESNIDFQSLIKLPLKERALAVIKLLVQSGFDINSICNSQIMAVCGSQRGGKGTLMGIVSTLMLALDTDTKLYYFTTGVDLYPFKCEQTISALNYKEKYPEENDANVKASQEIFKFFQGLDSATPGSLSNVVFMVDEVAGILKCLSESQVGWLLEFWLRSFAKTGATLFLGLHANNLTALSGKTTGWASQFREGVSWIGCKAESVPSDHPLRPILRATGEYFITDPNDFNKIDKHLGKLPEWLKLVSNRFTGQPSPVETMLKLFPEFYELPEKSLKRFNSDKPSIASTATQSMQAFLNSQEQPPTDIRKQLEDLFTNSPSDESEDDEDDESNEDDEDYSYAYDKVLFLGKPVHEIAVILAKYICTNKTNKTNKTKSVIKLDNFHRAACWNQVFGRDRITPDDARKIHQYLEASKLVQTIDGKLIWQFDEIKLRFDIK